MRYLPMAASRHPPLARMAPRPFSLSACLLTVAGALSATDGGGGGRSASPPPLPPAPPLPSGGCDRHASQPPPPATPHPEQRRWRRCRHFHRRPCRAIVATPWGRLPTQAVATVVAAAAAASGRTAGTSCLRLSFGPFDAAVGAHADPGRWHLPPHASPCWRPPVACGQGPAGCLNSVARWF